MFYFICENGHVFTTTHNTPCPSCNSTKIYPYNPNGGNAGAGSPQGQYENQSSGYSGQTGGYGGQTGQTGGYGGQTGHTTGGKTTGTGKGGVKPGKKKGHKNKKGNEQNGNEKNSKVFLGVVIALSVAIAVMGVVYFLFASFRIKEYNKEVEDFNARVSTGTDKEAEKLTYAARIPSKKGGYITEYDITDGQKIFVRTTGNIEMVVRPEPADASVPEFEWSVSDTEKLTVEGNQIKAEKETADGETVKVTGTSKDGKTKVSYEVEIGHGGWNRIAGRWYFITGGDYYYRNTWKEKGDEKCYLGADGAAVVGWLQIEEDGVDRAYYFDQNGIMVKGKTVDFGNDLKCIFDEAGYVKGGWILIKDGDQEKWYAYDEDGVMIKNTTKTIKGVKYTFDETGLMTKEE